MHTFLVALHVMVCMVLVLVVLLQRGKGSDIGASLGGGGGNTIFGSRGAGNFLTRLTTGSAIVFMMTSLTLAYLGNQNTNPLDLGDEVLELNAPPSDESGNGAAGDLEEVGDAASANALEEIPMPESKETE